MAPTKRDKAVTHEESTRLVCAVCFRKKDSARLVTGKLEQLIRKYVYEEYSVTNSEMPQVICNGCRITIQEVDLVSYFVI